MTLFNFTVRATDNVGAFADRNFSIDVANKDYDRYLVPVHSGGFYKSVDLNTFVDVPLIRKYGRPSFIKDRWFVTERAGATYNDNHVCWSYDGVTWESLGTGDALATLAGAATGNWIFRAGAYDPVDNKYTLFFQKPVPGSETLAGYDAYQFVVGVETSVKTTEVLVLKSTNLTSWTSNLITIVDSFALGSYPAIGRTIRGVSYWAARGKWLIEGHHQWYGSLFLLDRATLAETHFITSPSNPVYNGFSISGLVVGDMVVGTMYNYGTSTSEMFKAYTETSISFLTKPVGHTTFYLVGYYNGKLLALAEYTTDGWRLLASSDLGVTWSTISSDTPIESDMFPSSASGNRYGAINAGYGGNFILMGSSPLGGLLQINGEAGGLTYTANLTDILPRMTNGTSTGISSGFSSPDYGIRSID